MSPGRSVIAWGRSVGAATAQLIDRSRTAATIRSHRKRHRRSMARHLSLPFLVLVSTSIIACDDSRDTETAAEGFVAEISGAVTGRVSGPGLVRFVPARDAPAGRRPGYYFVADDSGVRELGITFTIPANTESGTYQLVSAHPMEIGEAFEVRVDHSVADRTESFGSNTTGTISVEAFPNSDTEIAGSRVLGSFEFSTQRSDGQEITGTGRFDFQGR